MSGLNLISIIFCFLLSLAIWAIIGYLWSPLKKFFHTNYSFFDVSFIIAYFVEQMIFIYLIFKFSGYAQIISGAFALIVITTASLQKLASESRLKKISEATIDQKVLLERTIKLNKEFVKRNRMLNKDIETMKGFTEETLKKQG